MRAPCFSYWRLIGSGQQRFLAAHTTSDFEKNPCQPTALLNKAGRVVALAWVEFDAQTQSSLWVLEASTVPFVQQHLNLPMKFARLQWAQQPAEPRQKQIFIPWIGEQHSGAFTAHDLSLDLLGFIDFEKGCYLGQEIVARTHSRVTHHKKRLFWLTTHFDSTDKNFLYSLGDLGLNVVSLSSAESDQIAAQGSYGRPVTRHDRGPLF